MARPQRNVAATAGRWSARHRRRAIAAWFAFVVAAFAIGGAVGQVRLESVDAMNGEAQRAERAVAAAFPDRAAENVLLQGRAGVRLGDSQFTAAVRDLKARLAAVPHVFDVRSPLVRGNEALLSADGRSALVAFSIRGGEDVWEERVVPALAATAAAQRAHPGLRIEQFGDASFAKALSKAFGDDFRRAEVTSLPVTLAILLVAFGSLVAAGVPLLLGLTAVVAGLGMLSLVSHAVPVDESAGSVVLLIGLAVGVDYSMFYLRRKLEERNAGRSSDGALHVAAATSGRAVLVSGLTVIIAMAGMLLAGNPVFTSFSIGTMLVVAAAMVGSVTVLPAVLSWLGDRVERGRVPFVARRRHRGDSRAWGWVLDRVLRRPAVALAGGAALLLALALPAVGMHTVTPGASAMPRDLPIMQTYDRVQAAFPGGPDAATVTVQAADVTAAPLAAAIARFAEQAPGALGMSGGALTTVSPDRRVAVVAVPLPGDGTDERSEAGLAVLRERLIPATLTGAPGVRAVDVGGMTAQSRDFNDTMKARLPYVFAFVLGLAFLLLLVTFRSVVVPAVAIALNLLSVGAAYGALKLIFQDGHGEGLLGFDSIGGVVSWLPLFLFVILFGLSMDYHVFILSRIREAHDAGMPTAEAVSHGIRTTAGVVTSAAVVMVAVFSIFATLSSVIFKQVGVALAVAVLIDATIVRAVLLPAVMKLLGERNWYLPRWLHRLPEVGGRAAARPAA